jgi:formylglycine-generating enzyme required for sulfatase activity
MKILNNEKKCILANCVWLCFALLPMALGTVVAQSSPSLTLPTPPNTVWLQDSVFIDKTEVANIHWLEYLHFLRKQVAQNKLTQAEYQAQIPDTSITCSQQVNRLTHPAYRWQPVVGISYEQAVRFCEWRSVVASEVYNEAHPAPAGLYWQFTYRLPTIKEWEKAAAGGLDVSLYPYGLTRLFDIASTEPVRMRPPKPLINYRDHKTKLFSLKKIDAYAPNGLGIYQMIGNVAEMTATQGIAKGGSWRHRKGACKIRKSQRYFAPDNWLGFRAICEVKLVEKTVHQTHELK